MDAIISYLLEKQFACRYSKTKACGKWRGKEKKTQLRIGNVLFLFVTREDRLSIAVKISINFYGQPDRYNSIYRIILNFQRTSLIY